MPARQTKLAKAAGAVTKRRSSRYAIRWTNPISNEVVHIRITHTVSYLVSGQDHIEVQVRNPQGARLPITETGYRSHFIPTTELINAGGPVTFVTAWIDKEAKSRDWQRRESTRAQGNLFDWAEHRATISKPMPKQKSLKTGAVPRRRVVADPDHIADLEMTDGQKARRMAARERGKPPKPPRGVE